MSLAEDLLNSLPEDQPAVTSADPATEPHIVINADKTITIPEALRRILVQYDHNIETVTFDCPRYWDGHDLSQMDLRIVFERSDSHKEPHPVENLRVDESDDRMIHFDWTISSNTTLTSGNIKTTVCAKLTNAEGVSEREWHTIPNQDLFVNEGMDCSGDEIVERNPDVIEYILAELDDLKNATPANPSTPNPDSGQNSYELPIGGEELGGVKNGGNVVINADGTMTAPENKPTDEQVGTAVSGWLEAHPEATTTVADHSLDPNKNTWMRKIGPINLYNPAETVAKTEVKDDGTEDSSNFLSCTGYIPVTPGIYVATGAPWYYAIYDKNGTFIKRFGASNSAVFDLSAQPEAAYLRLMYYGVPDASTFMVSRDALPDTFIAYNDPNNTRTDITDDTVARGVGRSAEHYFRENGINGAIPEHSLPVDKLPTFVTYLPNRFDSSKMEEGAVGSNGGDLGYEGNYRSHYIPVDGGETYYLYTPNAMGTHYASWVYDAEKNPVWRIPEGTNPVTVPSDVGAAYMRIGSVSEGTVVSIGTPSRTSIPCVPSFRFVDDAIRVDIRAYLMGTYGVRVFCIGDSITAGYSESGRVTTPWPMILNRDWRYNATNYGITGTTLSTAKVNSMSERLKSYDPAGCDVCLIMGGFNDGGEGVELGTIDSTDTATVYGALNDICNTLVTRYSGKRYGLITTPKYRASTNDWNIDTAIREVGAKWGVPVLDLHKCMMPLCQTDEIKAIYCVDGVHPLDPGHEILARIIAGWIATL